jgi:hypothetical protein
MLKFASNITSTAINDASAYVDGVPEWILVIPAGHFSGRDGRGPYTLDDPAKLLETTAASDMTAGLPLDFDHATDFGGPAPAAGWMRQFEIRDGAICARIEWTAKGRQAIASKEYRYVSPVFSFDEETGEILSLVRAGLTNAPNLRDTAICAGLSAQRKPMLNDNEMKIAHAMGISTEQFAHAKKWNGRLSVMGSSSPFPAHRPDGFGDNRGGGREAVEVHDADGDTDLAECCRTGTMEHLTTARAAIDREIQRRGGMSRNVIGIKFAK